MSDMEIARRIAFANTKYEQGKNKEIQAHMHT